METRRGLNFLHDVELPIAVNYGTTELSIRRLLALKVGSVVTFEREEGMPLEVRANGRVVARGEAVIVNDHYGLRVTEIVTPEGGSDEC